MPYSAMAFYPFILLKRKKLENNEILINHEKIHLKQQLELLVIPFYLLYIFNYMVNLFIYLNHQRAYREIVFEREAYSNDENLNYLSERKPWSFVNY